jgi:hypothetical protein
MIFESSLDQPGCAPHGNAGSSSQRLPVRAAVGK